MGLSKRTRKKVLSLFFLLLVFFEFNLFFTQVLTIRTVNVGGLSTDDHVSPNETVRYFFSNQIIFDITTNVSLDFHIEYDNGIGDRQTFFHINNSNPLHLNITSEPNIQNFGLPKTPQRPEERGNQYQYRYNCIFRVRTNITLEKLKIEGLKVPQYGFNLDTKYSLAIFDDSLLSWELIDTSERVNESSSETYLEGSLFDLEAEKDYYITYFELSPVFNDWIWILIILVGVIGVGALAVLLSKKDYFQYLKTRTISIEKGAHRLSLEEVLENKNRNKIIDIILKEPGVHFNELLRRTEIAAGNLVWHLDILETYKIIGKKRIGKYLAYFPYYQKNPISNIDLKLSKSKLTLEILETIEENPGIWNNLIKKKFKVDHKTIHYHIQKLKELDLIRLKKDGRKKKIYPNFDSDFYSDRETN
ncbi:MAG: hypothetical protein EU517_01310 [Promethearchaeota archaeon]|nr:MAG: hypothetical protein EU517_01310 [Candidatus Lokiarchaeota archaeon]